ncbi:MAG: hypothetical protein JWQ98_1016 [Chlorobi bacterium]|nr:hypothetical protein [Chlorobiota bacterium]
MKNASGFALVVVPALILSSCFFKSDETGSADNVKETMICHTPKGDYLITHEEIFHATSKSSGSSGTFISGYADYRFTVRELQSGRLVKRLVTGDRSEDILPLGYDGTRLWCYSADKEIGLHGRDPITLLVTVTQAQITAANPSLAHNLSAPAATEAGKMYSYDYFSGRVILTDLQGNILALDPATLRTTSIPKMPESPVHFHNASSTSAYRWGKETISLVGEPRRKIELSGGRTSRESYLNAALLLEQGSDHLAEVGNRMKGGNQDARADLRRQCDSLKLLYPVLSEGRRAYASIRDADIPNHYYEKARMLERLTEDSVHDDDRTLDHLSSMVLGCDSTTAYILHSGNLTDTSNILISRIGLKNGEYVTLWTTRVPNIFFDPSKGIRKNSLGDVFKSGNPHFDYEWYGVEGNVLVGIKMLFAFGIDILTGKLLWREQL